jgi:hypothetical protein
MHCFLDEDFDGFHGKGVVDNYLIPSQVLNTQLFLVVLNFEQMF